MDNEYLVNGTCVKETQLGNIRMEGKIHPTTNLVSFEDDLIVYFEKGLINSGLAMNTTWTVLNSTNSSNSSSLPFDIVEKNIDKKMRIRISAKTLQPNQRYTVRLSINDNQISFNDGLNFSTP